jgi:hypothetical protein
MLCAFFGFSAGFSLCVNFSCNDRLKDRRGRGVPHFIGIGGETDILKECIHWKYSVWDELDNDEMSPSIHAVANSKGGMLATLWERRWFVADSHIHVKVKQGRLANPMECAIKSGSVPVLHYLRFDMNWPVSQGQFDSCCY